ncbi:MAG: FAD/NAD(P)-binding protein [Acidimicrobiales bacterium]
MPNDRAGPLVPVPYRVAASRRETADVVTLDLAPGDGEALAFRAGQFTMLTAFGVGEAAISVSGSPRSPDCLQQTVRDVGPVTRALCQARPGDIVGVRGPFGTAWGVEDVAEFGGGDIVVVAGGIGLAPLRGAVDLLLHPGAAPGPRVFVLVGAREPAQVLFADDLRAWSDEGATVAVTVDTSGPEWDGHVGVVTTLLPSAGFDPAGTTALLCGPEIMMRFTARALVDLGVDPGRIRVSLERNMQCGVAWCGHCQLGPFLLCRDGPVLPYAGAVAGLLAERER